MRNTIAALGLLWLVVPMGSGNAKESLSSPQFPPISQVLSHKDTVRRRAMAQYLRARKVLQEGLAAAVHPTSGAKLPRAVRGNACFLLKELRPRDRVVIDSLIAGITEVFISKMKDVPYGICNPGDALVAIGGPAVDPIFDELGSTEDKQKAFALRGILENIEGPDCALIRVQQRIEKEKDVQAKARLMETQKYFEQRRAQRAKPN